MNSIGEQNRREANFNVNREKRELQVLKMLDLWVELTPKEVVEKLNANATKEDEKVDVTNVRPRLTELLTKREVCVVGRKKIEGTSNHECVYEITQKGKDRVMVAENMNHIPRID